MRISRMALDGRWSGGWHVQHRQPFGAIASHQKRCPLQQAHQSPSNGSSAGYDHRRGSRIGAMGCGSTTRLRFRSGVAAKLATSAKRGARSALGLARLAGLAVSASPGCVFFSAHGLKVRALIGQIPPALQLSRRRVASGLARAGKRMQKNAFREHRNARPLDDWWVPRSVATAGLQRIHPTDRTRIEEQWSWRRKGGEDADFEFSIVLALMLLMSLIPRRPPALD